MALIATFKRKKDESVKVVPKTSNVAFSADISLLKTDTKKCPYCAEEIKVEAIKCKHCGESLKDQEQIQNTIDDAKASNIPKPITGTINESGKFLGGIHHPWRRLFARTFDISTFGVIPLIAVIWAVGYYFPDKAKDFAEGLENPLIATIFLVGLWIPIEANLLSTLGYSPGKWLFGISVRSTSGADFHLAKR